CTSPCEYLPESFCDRPQCEWTDEFHPLCETKCSYFTDFGSCSVNYQCLWDGSTCGDACSYRYDEQVCTSSSLCAWNEDWEYCDDECAAHSDRAICNAVSACMWSGLQGGCSKGCYSLDTEQCAAEPICNIDSYGFCVPGCLYGEGTSQTCGFNEGCAWDVGNQACTPDCGAETDEASCEAIAHCAWGTAAGDTVPSCGVALHMFLLPISVGGKIGGISGADALCEGAEAHPGVGTYKALLVDGNARVACQSADCGLGGASEGVDWVLKPSMRYVVEGESGTVMTETDENAIFVLPLEAPLADSGFLWSGVNQNWTSGVSCSGWTNDALGGGDAYWGSAGSLSSTHIGVLSNGSYGCNPTTPMHILCVEQLP
ncbi:MAG: DUF1554 domain-containing protein, partial [Myxococcales bacterium]|nr:DUF1554 domain-containing protein [Myxococcales bacterium]